MAWLFFSAADVEVDESERREIAGKAAWKGVSDVLESFLVGRLAGQLANAGPYVFRLVISPQCHFIEPGLNGTGRVLFCA